jgi:uncharacterized protein YggU (UPF0235/DUF167 family)
LRLKIKAIPGSSRTRITGWLGDTLKVCVTAPAERGKANDAIEATVADALGIARSCVQIVAGGASARKTLEIVGISETEINRRLSRPPEKDSAR